MRASGSYAFKSGLFACLLVFSLLAGVEIVSEEAFAADLPQDGSVTALDDGDEGEGDNPDSEEGEDTDPGFGEGEGEGEDPDSGSGSGSGESEGEDPAPDQSAIETAKSLISALPDDPGAVTESDREAIQQAQAAYDALSAEEQAQLDSESESGKQSYGRKLESAQWALSSLAAIDSSTTLADGEYASFTVSVSSMGKSTSERDKSWTVSSFKTSGGQAWATIRCTSTSALRTMRIGGQTYSATVTDGVPEFTVPFNVNLGPIYFLVDANDMSDSIAYQIDVTMDVSPATQEQIDAANAKVDSCAAYTADTSYTQESRDALSQAASALASLASKDGVLGVELSAAELAIDDAVSALVKVSSGDGGNTDENSQTEQGSTSTSTGTVSYVSGSITPWRPSDSASSSTSSTETTEEDPYAPTTIDSVTVNTTGRAAGDAASSNTSATLLSLDETDIDELSQAASAASETIFSALYWVPAAACLFLLALGFLLRSVLFARGLNARPRPVA